MSLLARFARSLTSRHINFSNMVVVTAIHFSAEILSHLVKELLLMINPQRMREGYSTHVCVCVCVRAFVCACVCPVE